MKNKYETVSTMTSDGKTTFGILCKEDGRLINDISSDKDKINSLTYSFNELDLSPIHFQDVIEDFINS